MVKFNTNYSLLEVNNPNFDLVYIVSNLLLEKYEKSLDLQKKIVELMKNQIENEDEIFRLKVAQKLIDNEINDLLPEHTKLKKQIDEYEGK